MTEHMESLQFEFFIFKWSYPYLHWGPAYNKQKDAKETDRCRRVLLVTEFFNIAVYEYCEKNSACCRRGARSNRTRCKRDSV